MKFLIIGLGSMGKRRIRNLQHLGEKEIIGLDFKDERRKEAVEKYGIKTFGTMDEALQDNPDVFIISTPPNHHLEYEMLAAEKGKHFFCEAGVSSEGIEELTSLCKDKSIVAAPSCTLRFKDSIVKVKELVDNNKIGNVLAITYHMGQYLPDWHPWEDISKFYVGKRETSATREMVPFELEWLTWIFGDVKQVSCIKDKVSNLEVDIDDVYQLGVRFENGVIGSILVDVLSRTPTRILRVTGEKGTIVWDWVADLVKVYDAETKKWSEFREESGIKEEGYVAKENMYIEEIRAFLDKINGTGDYPYSLEDDLKVLNLLNAAEESSDSKKHIIIGEKNG